MIVATVAGTWPTSRRRAALVYATTTALVFVPKALTGAGLLPGGATPHGVLENVLGSAVPASSLPPW